MNRQRLKAVGKVVNQPGQMPAGWSPEADELVSLGDDLDGTDAVGVRAPRTEEERAARWARWYQNTAAQEQLQDVIAAVQRTGFPQSARPDA